MTTVRIHKGRKITANTRPTVPTGWAVDRSESVSQSQNQSAITPPYTLHPFVPCAQSFQACSLPTGGAWHPSNEHNRPIEICCPLPSPLLLNERTPPSHDCVDTHAHTQTAFNTHSYCRVIVTFPKDYLCFLAPPCLCTPWTCGP